MALLAGELTVHNSVHMVVAEDDNLHLLALISDYEDHDIFVSTWTVEAVRDEIPGLDSSQLEVFDGLEPQDKLEVCKLLISYLEGDIVIESDLSYEKFKLTLEMVGETNHHFAVYADEGPLRFLLSDERSGTVLDKIGKYLPNFVPTLAPI